MKLKLPTVVLALIKKQGGIIDPKLRATRVQLIKTCEEHHYTPHNSVIAFQNVFGGLVIPDEGKLKKGEPCLLFGTHACLTSGGHSDPRGGNKRRKLVPVIYSPNDIIYYLDEKGRAFAEDTIEDPSAVLCADNATALVCRVVIHNTMFSRSETSLELPGLQAKDLSKRFSLKLIKAASDKSQLFFSDTKGDVLVVEDIKTKRTQVSTATAKLFNLAKPPVSAEAKNVSPELRQYLGKSNLRMVSEQLTSLPEFFEHLPELRDLDVSINRLETLPESLWRATQLTSLNISFNPIKDLPDGIANMKALQSLVMRRCPIKTLPDALAGAKNLTKLNLSECEFLDVDRALHVIAKLPKLKQLSLPLATSLTSLAPLANLPLKSLTLNGVYVTQPARLPSGLGQLKKLTDLQIDYADDVALLPEAEEDVRALRLIFSKRFTDDDIRKSVSAQPSTLYLQAYVKTL